jgi:hypothetical protein
LAYIALFGQIVQKYGPYTELITTNDLKSIQNNEGEYLTVWNFNNFHIIISSVDYDNQFQIYYCSNSTWSAFEKRIIEDGLFRFPNNKL